MQNENNVERFANFKFITPNVMVDDDLMLKLAEMCPYNPEKKHVPEYKFAMVNGRTQAPMGNISLRVGLTKMLSNYGGHIGYEVDELYRGHRYATRSCRLLLPLIRALGIDTAVITCDPENIASVKTIESLGAKLVDTKEVEIESGDLRLTNIYHWHWQEAP